MKLKSILLLLLLPVLMMVLVGCGWSSQSEYSGAGWDHLSAFERHQANSPPDSDLITLNYNVVTRNVDLIGAAGAVPPDAVVVVAAGVTHGAAGAFIEVPRGDEGLVLGSEERRRDESEEGDDKQCGFHADAPLLP